VRKNTVLAEKKEAEQAIFKTSERDLNQQYALLVAFILL